jgi:curved DNA-binding protein CbpA
LEQLWEEDLYELLAVDPNGSPEEIKKAYRKLAVELHPDRFPDDEVKRAEATERFGKITNAYNVLKDEESKAEYDFARRMLGGMSAGPGKAGANGASVRSAAADEAVSDAKKSQAQNQFDQGKVFHSSKNWQKAISCYKEAVRLDPTVADYHAYLGVAYKQQGLKTPAQNAFAAAYKIDKKHKLLKEHYEGMPEDTKAKGKGKGKKEAKPSFLDSLMAMFSGGKKDAKGKPGAKKGTAPLKTAGAKK